VQGERFEILYDPDVREHLRAIDRKHHGLLRQTIEDRLSYEPQVGTRNRKPLTRPSVWEAVWELRLGPEKRFRVFYQTDRGSGSVHVLAIGEKRGERLFIGGEEFAL
jgi:mRNA-degrading endonuclease RelE of RelBE toxin-antitoxin system